MKTATAESLILFNRQLASMVGLDLPLPESLRRAGTDLQDPLLAKTVAELAADVEHGVSFSDAVAKRRSELPEIYGALVKAGESSGNLGEALRHAASYEEQMLALSHKLKANLIYPVLLAVLLVGLLALFGIVILPKFGIIYRSFDATLPLATRIVMSLSGLMGHWLTYTLMVPAGVAVYRFRVPVWGWLGKHQFRIPVWNEFVRTVLMARFCKTLGHLLERGVGIAEALTLTRGTMGNGVFEEAVAKAGAAVERGGKLSEALSATGVFPATATWLLAASEERGDVVPCLLELGDYYHHAAERRGKMLAALIEPILIMLTGLIVGIIVVSLFMPLFSLGGLADQ